MKGDTFDLLSFLLVNLHSLCFHQNVRLLMMFLLLTIFQRILLLMIIWLIANSFTFLDGMNIGFSVLGLLLLEDKGIAQKINI